MKEITQLSLFPFMNSTKPQYLYSVSVEKAYHKFFASLAARVNTFLKPPTAVDQAYIFPADIVCNPVLMSNTYTLLKLLGADIRNHVIRAIVARKLLLWLIKERPDIVNEMLQT